MQSETQPNFFRDFSKKSPIYEAPKKFGWEVIDPAISKVVSKVLLYQALKEGLSPHGQTGYRCGRAVNTHTYSYMRMHAYMLISVSSFPDPSTIRIKKICLQTVLPLLYVLLGISFFFAH